MSSNTNSNSNKGYYNKSLSYVKGANKVVVVLVGLFLLLVVGMIVYWVYKAVQRSRVGDVENPILVAGSIDASNADNSKQFILPTSSGSGYSNMAFTMSFWIYIRDWQYRFNEPKAIIIKDVDTNGTVSGSKAAPGIWLDSGTNNLIVKTRVMNRNEPQVCNVPNIPLQKWVHIAYVLDNRTVDVYVDCKLERSCILTGVPLLNNHPLQLFPRNPNIGSPDNQTGFFGQLSSLRYFSSALRPVDVARLCNEGPNATVGEPTSEHKPKPENNGSCDTKIDYEELSRVQKQLGKINKEVDQLLEEQGNNGPYENQQLWDIRVKTGEEPTMKQVYGQY